MKSNITRLLSSFEPLQKLVVTGLLLLPLTANMNAGEPREGAKLVGTWFTTVTLKVCGTDQEIRSFTAFGTFASGGTLTDTTTAFSPALRSPGHGVWEQTGRNRYSSISLALLFNAAGLWTGTQRITQDIQIKKNRFASNASVTFFDTAGNVTMKGCASATATRVEPVEGDDDPLIPSQEQ